MITNWRRLPVLVAVLLGAGVVAAGCGSSDSEADFNDTDATFAAQMIPHHEHAVEMANLAVKKSPSTEVRDLAQGIIETQMQEISQLQGFLDTFGADVEQAPAEVAALNEGTIAELEAASGPEFDQLFLKAMSAHHSSAVDMAGLEINGGDYDQAVSLAESIKATQIEEIGEMNRLLASAG